MLKHVKSEQEPFYSPERDWPVQQQRAYMLVRVKGDERAEESVLRKLFYNDPTEIPLLV